MALAIPDSVREAIGDRATVDLFNWANKSFEHNLDLRLNLLEERLTKKIDVGLSNLRSEFKSDMNSLTWKLIGFMTTQTALILGFIYFIHK